MALDSNNVRVKVGDTVKLTSMGGGVRKDLVFKTGKLVDKLRTNWVIQMSDGEMIKAPISQFNRSFVNPEIELFNFWGQIPLLSGKEHGYTVEQYLVPELRMIHRTLINPSCKVIMTPPLVAMVEFTKRMLDKAMQVSGDENYIIKMTPDDVEQSWLLYTALAKHFDQNKRQAELRKSLKWLLMEMGNRLVTEHGYVPGPNPHINRADDATVVPVLTDKSTAIITLFTMFVNEHEAARQVLKDLGQDWPMSTPAEAAWFV